MPDPLALAELVAGDLADDAARAWLADGLRRWLALRGVVPLTRVLRLPNTAAGVRGAIARRWLTEAAIAPPEPLSAWEAAHYE